MDPELKGRKIGEVVKSVLTVMHTASEPDSFHEFAYERLGEFVLEHERENCTRAMIEKRAKELLKQYTLETDAGADGMFWYLADKYGEGNERVEEMIREALVAELEEVDFDDYKQGHWEDLARQTASSYFNEY